MTKKKTTKRKKKKKKNIYLSVPCIFCSVDCSEIFKVTYVCDIATAHLLNCSSTDNYSSRMIEVDFHHRFTVINMNSYV